MRQVIIRNGEAQVDQVPCPQVEPDTVLVDVHFSCISAGTELSGVKSSGEPLWKRALKQPDNVKKVVQLTLEHGVCKAKSVVQGKIRAGNATGYSASGRVINVGANITDLQVGDWVACAGAQCAHHADYINVPRNLCARIPTDLSVDLASTVTLGAIALQGVRRANPTLGETFVVVGLGILGQLTAQMLKANGCKVLGMDLDQKRLGLASQLGMDCSFDANDRDIVNTSKLLTDGYGVDGAIITAAAPSSDIVSNAFKMCRKKGRVVVVGDVGMDIKRPDIYEKELDFFISTSYGPGRYDRRFEEEGVDYPLAYVRWTETRNMEAYLALVKSGAVKLDDLISASYPVGQAGEAYRALENVDDKPLINLLSYSEGKQEPHTKNVVKSRPFSKDKIAVALVGPGGFAKAVHLPNLQKLHKQYEIKAVCSRTGHNANAVTEQFLADYATTSYEDILFDKSIDAVIICTRHDLHGGQVLEALQAGKHVLVEKPLCLSDEELKAIADFYNESLESPPVLLTGFNRRFSPCAREIKKQLDLRTSGSIIQYVMNAGLIPNDSWIQTKQGGGRNRGEACHIYDLFTYWLDAKIKNINAVAANPNGNHYARTDNFSVNLEFDDGSIANLIYTAKGNKEYAKEEASVFVDGKLIKLNDYKGLVFYGLNGKRCESSSPDKGHFEELKAFSAAIQTGDWPIPLWQQLQTTAIANDVEKHIVSAVKSRG